jgi:hypothetical protein
MSAKPRTTRIQKVIDNLAASGESFVLIDVAHELNTTSQKISRELRGRKNCVCIERPTGKPCGENRVRYQFLKECGVKCI